jgi:hypothetical protein
MSDLKDYNTKLSKMISNPLEYNSSAPPEVKYYDGEKNFGTFIRTDQISSNSNLEVHEYQKENVSFRDNSEFEILNRGASDGFFRRESEGSSSIENHRTPHTNCSTSQEYFTLPDSFLSFSAEEYNTEDASQTNENPRRNTSSNVRELPENGCRNLERFGRTISGLSSEQTLNGYEATGSSRCLSENEPNSYIKVKLNKNEINDRIYTQDESDDVNLKDMSAKLKQLKIQLYKNSLHSEKKAACFWCTYDFDNASCYIPKYEMDGTIYGYGSFCRPECAVAYLMKENIDDSTKFDRYHLLNQIYSKVYECKKNIKPAPDPHYLLDKFYGNLTIQEYRRLLKTEHLLLVIDKPLTRILPELHEDTDDAFTKIYGIKATSGNSSGVYKVKRQSEQPQGPSKASIIKNTFGIST